MDVRRETGIETYVNDEPGDPNPGVIVDGRENRGRALSAEQARALAAELVQRAEYAESLTTTNTSRPPALYTYADLSTSHLPQDEMDAITVHAPARVIEHEWGAWVNVLPIEDEGIDAEWADFPELRKVMAWAREKGARWINFDADGDITEDLATWEW